MNKKKSQSQNHNSHLRKINFFKNPHTLKITSPVILSSKNFNAKKTMKNHQLKKITLSNFSKELLHISHQINHSSKSLSLNKNQIMKIKSIKSQ